MSKNFMNYSKTIITTILLIFFSSCSQKPVEELQLSAEESYNKAIKEANNENYLQSADLFEKVEKDYPYSHWAVKAKVMSAWVYYEVNKYDAAILSAERFIKNHPTHDLTPYAYYLIGMSYYERIIDVERDSKMTFKAKESFENLIKLYPDSDYAREAKLKIELARSNIAGKQMAIGRFYQSQKQFSAAIRRFKIVIDNYETTDQTPEALLRLSECYLALGAKEEAERSASVLIYNFPNSEWVKKLPKYFNNSKESLKKENNNSGFFKIFTSIFE